MRLVQALGGRLPPELAAIRELLAAKREDALHTLRVERVEGVPALTRWQKALVDKLNRDAGELGVGRGARRSSRRRCWRMRRQPVRPVRPLGVLQSRLFGASAEKAALDASVQWVGVRDFLQEAEVAAGHGAAAARGGSGTQAGGDRAAAAG